MDEQKGVGISFGGAPRGLVSLTLLALIGFLGVQAYSSVKEARNAFPENTVVVSGEGKVFVKPDIGTVTLTVMRESKTVGEAQKNATEAAEKVVAFLKEKGIEDKDVKTINYSIYPQYDYLENKGQVLRGYQVSQSFEVKIRKTDMAGDIIAGAASAGANQVGDLRFTTEDPDALREEARKLAIKDAKEKAKKLEDELGVDFEHLVSFSESGGGMPPPIFYAERGYGMGGDTASVKSVPTPTGENEIVVSVSLVYAIDD